MDIQGALEQMVINADEWIKQHMEYNNRVYRYIMYEKHWELK